MHKVNSFWQEFLPKSWKFLKKYNFSFFKSDLIAGITVGVVALPLAMAFGIASGVTPERGIYTAIIAGFLISLLGGSRLQIGGPTGAFVVIIYDVVQRMGYDGLILVTFIAGLILLIAALCRIGSWIKFIPYPLITGFTTGIALIIFSSQVKDFLGLHIDTLPASFIPKWGAIFSAMPTFDPATFLVALGTLSLILIVRKFFPILPWGITAVVVATAVTAGFHIPIETIYSRFGEISRAPPIPSWPDFSQISNWRSLIPDAITIAFLAGIESLLSAIVADGMAGTRHKSNCELMAQGFANIGSVIFGGIPATGAIARTATNVKTGAKTPVAGMIHAITLLLILLLFAPLVSKIPLAALSAVLMMVAWNMSELHHFRHLFKAPPGDVAILLITFALTVLVDLTVAVEIGMVLAAFLFMKRMGDISGVVSNAFIEKHEPEEHLGLHLPSIPKVEIYEITGPYFFGIADSLIDVLRNLELPPKVFILRMRKVPIIDATGMHALEDFYDTCRRQGTTLLLSEVKPSLLKSLRKFDMIKKIGEKNIFFHFREALESASKISTGDVK